MKNIAMLPSFSTIQQISDAKKGSPNYKAREVATELDSYKDKYSDGSWKSQRPSNHYRNTFVEAQTNNYLKRINKI